MINRDMSMKEWARAILEQGDDQHISTPEFDPFISGNRLFLIRPPRIGYTPYNVMTMEARQQLFNQ